MKTFLDVEVDTYPEVYEAEGMLAANYQLTNSSDDEPETDPDIVTDSIAVADSTAIFKNNSKQSKRDPDVYIKDESVVERLHRLQFECNQLELDLKTTDSNIQNNIQLSEQVSILQSRLSTLEQSHTNPLEKIYFDNDSRSRLIKEIQSFKSLDRKFNATNGAELKKDQKVDLTQQAEKVVDNQSLDVKQQSKNALVYELVYDSTISPKHQKDIELEARITNLERIVGLHALDPIDSVLSKEDGQSLFSTSGTLIGSLERIDHHLVLLTQPEVLAESLKRVKEATASLETLIDLRRKQKIEASISNQSQSTVTLEKQINYLYEKMTRLEPIGNMIPNILLRLKALQSLHTEVAQTVEKLQILTEDQEKLKKVTSNNSQGLSLLQKTLAKDQSQITDNIAALDTRINDLLTKINKNNR